MTLRGFVVGAFGAVVFVAAFAAASAVSAEVLKKKPGGAGICVSKPMPDCNLFLKATCEKKSACGGCLKWVCKP